MVIETRIINEDTGSTITENVVCSNCHCDCHCKEPLHTPSDELDTSGLCTCEDCQCQKKKHDETIKKNELNEKEWLDGYNKHKGFDEDSFNGA
tara:strand:- start:460 stop:738 length:279 start_codon:yes stop_codon:yes gene_type:complete